MQTSNNTIAPDTDIRTLIQNALLNFKAVSRQIRSEKNKGIKLSNLALYALLCLRESKPLLRNDIMKRLHVNYYDAGNAIDQLILNGFVVLEIYIENSNIKSMHVNRTRYRLTLNGECFLDTLINRLSDYDTRSQNLNL